jgi:hypothetical protein
VRVLIVVWCLMLLFVVYIVVSSIVVLTQNGQLLSCAIIAFSDRYEVTPVQLCVNMGVRRHYGPRETPHDQQVVRL